MNLQAIEIVLTDHRTRNRKKRFVYVGASFESDSQSSMLMQPRQRSFDDPAMSAQAAAIFSASFGQDGVDTFFSKCFSMGFRVVGSVALDGVGFATGSTGLSPNRRDRFEQRKQLGDVVGVRARQNRGQRNAVSLSNHMMFAARFALIRGVRAGFRPPKTARTDALSTTVRDQSIWSASRNLASKTSCSSSHIPADCQSRRYRQQVIPDPQPISWGNISQGMPLLSTNRIPVSTLRRSIGLRPGYRRRRGLGDGRRGSISFHNSSETNCLAMCRPPFSIGPTHVFGNSNAKL